MVAYAPKNEPARAGEEVAIVGNAIVRHLWVSESELDGKVTNTKIGVLQVWQKQDSGWKLLARASFRLPEPTAKS